MLELVYHLLKVTRGIFDLVPGNTVSSVDVLYILVVGAYINVRTSGIKDVEVSYKDN